MPKSSPFMIFVSQKITGKKSIPQKVAEAAPLWEAMSEEEKKPYRDRARELREEAREEGGAAAEPSVQQPTRGYKKSSAFMLFLYEQTHWQSTWEERYERASREWEAMPEELKDGFKQRAKEENDRKKQEEEDRRNFRWPSEMPGWVGNPAPGYRPGKL